MVNIIEKYKSFRAEKLNNLKNLFEELGKGQKPHTLFISCSDSRVIPELITNSNPGELFVIRNVANIVPKYDNSDISATVSSAIEYAVNVLEVQNIVVCGHHNCGGCAALHLEEEKLNDKPNLKKWVSLSKDVGQKAREIVKDDPHKLAITTEQLNIVKQLENLMTYPFIKEKVQNGKLKIYGWYYVISTGEILNYNYEKQVFEQIT
ncbi:MAG: carbonic anhydrase [Brevinematales bacterium]|nr:carbonic anhydrase [Brevinematales bacterium]